MNDIQRHKAKQKLKADLKNSQWSLQAGDGSAHDFSLMLYCYDPFNTGEMLLTGLTAKDIEHFSSMNHPIDLLASAIDAEFSAYTNAKNDKIKRKKTEMVSKLGAAYALQTETFKKLKATPAEEGKTKHFIILLYRNQHVSECNLRPFSLMSDQNILTIDDIKSASSPIIQRDKEVNPSFFHLSPVVQFR